MPGHLEMIAEAYSAGTVDTDQTRLSGRVYANRRVAGHMADYQDWFLDQAQQLEYVDFAAVIRQWERLMDQDGAEPAAERSHHNRDFTLTQDPIGVGWEIRGGTGPLAGAALADIFEHHLRAERLADWEQARALHGDAATTEQLPRNEAQRRADTPSKIFANAAATPADSTAPASCTTSNGTKTPSNRCSPPSPTDPNNAFKSTQHL